MAPAAKTAPRKGSDRRLLYVAGAALAVVVFLYLRRRSSSGGLEPGSGTPGPDNTGSTAQQPNGGASSVPAQMPDFLVTQPDTLQQQVQQTNAGSSEAPASFAPIVTNPAGYDYVVQQYQQPPQQYQPPPQLQYYNPYPPAAPPAPTNVHQPGAQLE